MRRVPGARHLRCQEGETAGTARPSCRVRLDLGPTFPSEPAPASASGRVPGAQPPVAGVAFGGPPAVARPGPSACDVGTRAAPHRGVTAGPGSPTSSTRTLRRGRPNLPDHIPLPQSPGLASDTLGCQATSPSPTRSTNESEKGLGADLNQTVPAASGVCARTRVCVTRGRLSQTHGRVVCRALRTRVRSERPRDRGRPRVGGRDRSALCDFISARFRGNPGATLRSGPARPGDALPGGSRRSRAGRRGVRRSARR